MIFHTDKTKKIYFNAHMRGRVHMYVYIHLECICSGTIVYQIIFRYPLHMCNHTCFFQ